MTQDVQTKTYDSQTVANEFLELASKAGEQLTQMKLQKLVYFAHGWSFALVGKPLLNEQVQAWSFGPVIRSLYDEFRDFGAGPITRKATVVRYLAGVGVEEVPAAASPIISSLIRKVWEVYGRYSAVQLSNMTHAQGTPWDKVNRQYGGNIPKHTAIPEEWIKEYFVALEKEQ